MLYSEHVVPLMSMRKDVPSLVLSRAFRVHVSSLAKEEIENFKDSTSNFS